MSNMMSQEEIDAMLRVASGGADKPEETKAEGAAESRFADALTSDEIDALGEIGNICMGTSATTMYTLLDRRVNITTPTVRIYDNLTQMLTAYDRPYVAVQVEYCEGLHGNNILLLKVEDAQQITSLLMGGDGTVEPGTEIGELELSAMSEVMNQMVGSSATAMANLMGTTVNIAPPVTALVSIQDEAAMANFKDDGEPIVRINFDMEIQGVLKSEIMQIMSLGFSKNLVGALMQSQAVAPATAPAPAPAAPPPPPKKPPEPARPAPAPVPAAVEPRAAAPYMPPPPQHSAPPVDVQGVQYQSFDNDASTMEPVGNLGIIMDVPLQVTVELGKTKKSIKEILDLGKGSVVVLDKLAGEMVEVMANGKLIARGEVVVIDDNYGVRITEIIAPARRIDFLN